MEYVRESVNQNIINWTNWVDTYVYKHSDLYKQIERMNTHIPYHDYTGNICIKSPYRIWIDMLRSPDITIEPMEITSCSTRYKKRYKHRAQVMLNDMVIAVIDEFKNEYKYVTIPHRCYSKLLGEYLEQLL